MEKQSIPPNIRNGVAKFSPKVKIKRFQECSNLEKFWRYRWYLTIPFRFIVIFASTYAWELSWSIAKGKAQFKMDWYYTHEEVMDRIDKHLNSKKENDDLFNDSDIGYGEDD